MSAETIMAKRVKLLVNKSEYNVDVEPYDLLSEVLRYKLGLTGTKRGCDYGGCGCCSVLVDGEVRYSCMTPVMRVEGKQITTVEGLEKDGKLHPVQQAFIDHFGFQCGYCTPGMIMASVSLLSEDKDPSEDEIREGLGGVLCRCTGYMKIIESVRAAAETMKEGP
jgi:carbon-monoxide dehydrogenase small subunit